MDGFFYVHRESHPSRYDIKSELALEEPGVIGPPFNLSFHVRAPPAVAAHQYSVFYLKILKRRISPPPVSDSEPGLLSSQRSAAEP